MIVAVLHVFFARTLEPTNATTVWTSNRCEVWTGTQNGEAAFAETVAASGLPAEKCGV
jgi:isoquinoline 1-oxidoreductase beta subunit